MPYIGIDPGLGGGLAMIDFDGRILEAVKMPQTERDVYDTLQRFAATGPVRAHAALEFVRSSPQQGVVSAFRFGQGYGALRMALVAVSLPFDEVTPRRWQGALGCLSGGDKNVTKRRAQELFPDAKVTHAIADALLIAEYNRRASTGILVPTMRGALATRTAAF